MSVFHTITIQKTTFQRGLNLTVRFGPKWTQDVSGDLAQFRDPYGEFLFRSSILCRTLPLEAITDSDLVYEHDPDCRTVAGLRKTLVQFYGPMKDENTVALIYFLF